MEPNLETVSEFLFDGNKLKLMILGGVDYATCFYNKDIDVLITSISVSSNNTLTVSIADGVVYKCLVDKSFKILLAHSMYSYTAGHLSLAASILIGQGQHTVFDTELDPTEVSKLSRVSVLRTSTEPTTLDKC